MPPGAKPGHVVSEETRQKIREALTGRKLVGVSPNRGRKQSPETIRKRADGQRKYDTDECSVDGCDRPRHDLGYCGTHARRFRLYGDPLGFKGVPSGANHVNWKGDNIGYDTAHIRARRTLGKTCVACGSTRWRIEAALLHDSDPISIRQAARGPYSIKASDYVALCIPCHRQYDSPIEATRTAIENLLRGTSP